jgi:hypothetical protein
MPREAFGLRDQLIDMLEDYWPELGPSCSKPSPKKLQELLRRIAAMKHRHHSPAALHLLENFEKLTVFLGTERYSGDPRQIANALAGVPSVSWWTSLKLCAAQPCLASRGIRSLSDYLRRKRPEIFKLLDNAGGDVLKIAVAFKHVRSQDATVRLLQSNAQLAAQVWREGFCNTNRISPGPRMEAAQSL